ncbi:choice-of-anchor D domain-containing protein [Gelatiniphilus marinus]|uniref:Choice-of-anchor D domain-containing protein n=1 Tax=Gelatiniphilus marinus TaxID=1759464 RepID=A0ABW5JT51_9FLAO
MMKKLLILALLLCSVQFLKAQNPKLIYIDEDNREIRTIKTDGTDEVVFFKNTEALSSRYITVNNSTQEIFFSTGSPYSIYKKNFDGTLEQKLYTSSGVSIYNLAIDEANSKLYWVEYQELKRSNLDGTSVETIINLTTDVYLRNLTIGGGKLYWSERLYNTSNFANTYYLKRANLDGTGIETLHSELVPSGQLFVNELGTIYGMQVDDVNNVLYWASSSADGIFKKNSDGSGGVTKILNDTYVKSPRGLALDVANNKLFWTDSDSGFDNLRSANLNGSSVTVLSSVASDPYGLALASFSENPVGIPEIDIQGNSASIANNDATPDTSDNTDFGSIALNNNYKDNFFFVRNMGGSSLSLSGSPVVAITGDHAADFTLQTDVASNINATSNSYFTIRFDPSVLGLRTATVTINSNDSDETVYTFNIQGTGDVSSGEMGTNDVRLTTHATGQSLDNEDPDIAYDPTLNRFLMVYETEVVNKEEEIFGQFINPDGSLNGSAFQISLTGPNGNFDIDASNPKIVFNTVSNQYFVVWEGDMDATNQTEKEIFGQLINPDGTLVGGLGTGQIRISQHGTDGDELFNTYNPSLSVNTSNGEYYLVWQANSVSNAEVEIYGTRLLSNGTLVAGLGAQTKLSSFTASNQAPSSPNVAYNTSTNQFLVVYHADFPVNSDNNVFGQIVAADGSLVSGINTPIQITNVAASRDADYANVVYNKLLDEYFVAFQADHINPTDGEDEIFGQRIANDGTLVASAMQISFAGIDGDGEETGSFSSIGYNTTDHQILFIFQSEEPGSNSYDIFATTLDATNYTALETQSRVSDMGDVNGDNTYTAQKPKQAFNTTTGNFLIVWEGDDNVPGDGEDEVFGQLWRSPPIAEIDVRGNSNSIADGDNTPDINDFTDFGSIAPASSVVREFTVHNTNTEQLVLNGSPTIEISGANASDFSVTKLPSTAIDAGNSTTFEITFSPTTVGVKTATISIDNNDAGENPYDFTIQGEADGALSLDEALNKKSDAIKIYPNPTTDYISINGLKKSSTFSIFNVLGTEVLKGLVSPEGNIDVKNLKIGLYFMKIYGSNTVKFIKK